jgi:dTDP-4-amino-4,6-dideoxygalactose transaminase
MKKPNLTRREFLERASAGVCAAGVSPRILRASGNPDALALHGGTPVRSEPFPGWPQTTEIDEQNILKSLRNHRWCTFDGEFIPKFEKAWAEKVGSRGCVMTPCGTHALHMALELLGVGPGDEVIVAPFTFIATIDAIMLCYALPVFADSDVRTFQIDADDIEHRITENTRAILPVHILGAAANMDKIQRIAKKHNLPIIEDACQGHMTEWRGRKVGTLGTLGCFSFQESKNLPGGEAGALVSDNDALIAKAYSFRDFGRDPKAGGCRIRGTKYRISDFAAAVLMAQLTRFDELCARRVKHAIYLRQELKNVRGLLPQEHYAECTYQNYYCFGLRFDSDSFAGATGEQVVKALKAEGIPIDCISTRLNKEPFIEDNLSSRGFRVAFSQERLERYRNQNHLPHNDELCATCLGLSSQALIGERDDVDDVLEAFSKVQKNAGKLSLG